MTLTTQDLRDAMDAYIDEVRVPNSEAMLAGVRDRVRADRRRGRTRCSVPSSRRPSSRPASANCAARSPPPTIQTPRPSAAATIRSRLAA